MKTGLYQGQLDVTPGDPRPNVWACGATGGGSGNFTVPAPGTELDVPSFEESAFGFQCTELADRLLWVAYEVGPMYYSKYNAFNLVGGNFVASAAAEYGLPTMSSNSNELPSQSTLPAAGDIISMWGASGKLVETGDDSHVAVVTSNPVALSDGGWSMKIMEENAQPQTTGWNSITVSKGGVWTYGPGGNYYPYTNFQWLVQGSSTPSPAIATAVAAHLQGYCALLKSQQVECWGTNQFGLLGDGGIEPNAYVPVYVKGLAGVKSFAGGNSGEALDRKSTSLN